VGLTDVSSEKAQCLFYSTLAALLSGAQHALDTPDWITADPA